MEIQSIAAAQQFNENRFTKIDMIKTKSSVVFMLNFLPGQQMKPHNHPNRELYLHVLEGEGTLLIDNEEIVVKQGELIYCNAEEKIGFINTSETNVSIYATMNKMED
ncbi:cupin domain-containing protein [Pseudogracilibacillus sp. SE30717A]|uniref:cupin domain-containing protein n=1 Tax=Pseudogracilibacillus sp. SE30717A TaxID=3098293 RepID=UPI00300E61DE